MEIGQGYVTSGDKRIKRVNPRQGIHQIRRVWVGLSIGKREKRVIRIVRRATKVPATTKTTYKKNDVDTETEVVCQVGLNARDA